MRRTGVDRGEAGGAWQREAAPRRRAGLTLCAAALIAASVVAAAPGDAQASSIHVVQKGETLSHIAKAYGTTVEMLVVLNEIDDPNRIREGQRLLVSITPTIHVVAKGETLWEIAKTYGMTVQQLASWNGISDPGRIYPGQELIVSSGGVHRVRAGETLSSIAKRYGVTVQSLVAVNNLADPDRIATGQRLIIPPMGGGAVEALTRTAGAGVPRPFGRWPVTGTVSSSFGLRSGRQHEGLDIAAPHGTPVRAVAPGTVTYADWAGTYGLLVIIDHGGGIETRYAHASRVEVSVGQRVNAGDVVARVGSTGRSTGPHLHFEVRVNGQAVDPARWLP